jgi:hypothetical protein
MAEGATGLEENLPPADAGGPVRLGKANDPLSLEIESDGGSPGDPVGIGDNGLHGLAVHRGRCSVQGKAEAPLDPFLKGVDLMVFFPIARIGPEGSPERGAIGFDSPVEMAGFAGEIVSHIFLGVEVGVDENEFSLPDQPAQRAVGECAFRRRGKELEILVS